MAPKTHKSSFSSSDPFFFGKRTRLLGSPLFFFGKLTTAALSSSDPVNMLFTFIIAQAFLVLLCKLKFGLFFFFAGWVVIMTVSIAFFFLEMKGVPIEEMVQVWKDHWFWRRFFDEEDESSKMPADNLAANDGGGLDHAMHFFIWMAAKFLKSWSLKLEKYLIKFSKSSCITFSDGLGNQSFPPPQASDSRLCSWFKSAWCCKIDAGY